MTIWRVGAAAVGFLLFARPVAAQAPSSTDSIRASSVAARWDSLYTLHKYFLLRTDVAANAGRASARDVQYFRGMVAAAFNDPEGAIAVLKPLVDRSWSALTYSRRLRALVALGDSYVSLCRYDDAAVAYRRAFLLLTPATDSVFRAGVKSSWELTRALAGVLPERVKWSAPASLDTIPNGGIRARMLPRINGRVVESALQVSITSRFMLLDSTTAAKHNVRLLPAQVTAASMTGLRTTASVGILESLELSSARVTNVPVLVLRDSDLTTADQHHVTGIIGFTVLNAIGRVSLTMDGHIALSAPGSLPVDTVARAPFALDVASHSRLTPVVQTTLAGEPALFTLTFAAGRTVRYSSAGDAAQDSAAGKVEQAQRFRHLALKVGGRMVELDSVPIASPGVDPEASLFAGRLGADALAQADAVTLDFSTMTVGFEQAPPPPVLPVLAERAETPATKARQGSRQLVFIGLLFALFIVPRALQRFRIPGAITSLLMGILANRFGAFSNDPTLQLLSTLGIVALFLFAGLEIDGRELQRNVSALIHHTIAWTILATITAVAAAFALGLSARAAALVALALVTPSTGFILSSLSGFGLSAGEQRTVKTYAVGSELTALAVLFLVLQSTSLLRLVLAIAAMAAVVLVIPLAFRFFAHAVAPYAPRSEFAFLLMVAVVCSYTTRRLGVYYLVGAFLVGVAAQRFRSDHPAMSSEKMVDALESFGSVFIPFYFFHAGTEIIAEEVSSKAIGVGLLLLALFVPLRVAFIGLHRKAAVGEAFTSARRIGSALIPTLVFTLVVVTILRERFELSGIVAGGLVLYTILNTLLPAFALRGVPVDFEEPAASDPGN